VVVFLVAAARHIMGMEPKVPGFYTEPFYNRSTFSWVAIGSGTSLAVLTPLEPTREASEG